MREGMKVGTPIFIKNLDKNTGERDLRELFGRHGAVAEVDIPHDNETGLGRGFAFVTMANVEEASKCIKLLNFTKPFGRALVVERYKRPGEPASPDDEASDGKEDGVPIDFKSLAKEGVRMTQASIRAALKKEDKARQQTEGKGQQTQQ